MTAYYPIVIETETNGAVSAYVPGLPVYAAADTRAKAERAIRETLAAYLDAHPTTFPTTRIRVARVSDNRKSKAHVVESLVGVGALLGTGRSAHKANASRANGRLGGRPRRSDHRPMKAGRRA
jgi:predicted RNase H-like HicB family nuclease